MDWVMRVLVGLAEALAWLFWGLAALLAVPVAVLPEASANSVTWAHVSEEIDQRLRAQTDERIKLAPAEWKSGEITWLIDMAGEPRALAATLGKLNETVFANKQVHVWTIGSSGEKQVLMLGDILKHASRDGALA